MGVFKRWIKSKDGKKTAYWYIRYMVNGKDKWESVGKVGLVTKAMAQAKLEERKRQVRLGQLDIIGTEIPTVAEFAKEYIKYVRDVAKKRAWWRDTYGLRHFLELFKGKKLSEVTPKDIDDYKRLRLAEVKPSTVNRELQVIRYLFNLAKRWKKFYGDNPVSQSGLIPVNNQVERILTPEEEERLLSVCNSSLRAIIITALNTGMRKGEILSLRWEDVDLENNLITVRHDISKSKKVRRIPINATLRKLLLEQKLRDGSSCFVFPNSKGNPYKRHDSVKGAFERACKKAGIHGLRFHDLRHTAATRMVETGASIVAISRILGHSDLKTTMRYTHPEDSVREAIEKLSTFAQNRSKNRSNEEMEKV
ncbi:MAG: hypothetical protein KatS3mg078_2252 [Deltaproteobacteria bacterium]|nr:Tyrosine recombinase XerC [bacterium HR37]GIW48375.1 MAG: hypothetical protein KatS3mg078_2252 [Deltaproteobacteria bacterium]